MRDLTGLFEPERVAVVGASPREGSIGRAVTANLLDGFDGEVVPVNPNHASVLGITCVPSIREAGGVDLAVVAVPADAVADVLVGAGEAGVGNVVVITAGFAEAGEAGAARERELRSIADTYGMALIGPNSVGIMSTPVGLDATFAPTSPVPGSISLLSQSGAFVTAALDWATDRGIGFRDVVSLGNEAVLTETDVIAHWGDHPGTDVVVGYIEGIDDGRAFVETCRGVTRETPVVLLKAGRSAAGAAAAASHTGSMAGSDRAYDAGFREAGVIRAGTVEELFDLAVALAGQPPPPTDGVGVVTNAGGPGVLASDALAEAGLSLASFEDETAARLEAFLPDHATAGNPLDLVGDAGVDRFRRGLDAVLEDPGVGAGMVLSAPTALLDYDDLADAVVEAGDDRNVPLLGCLMGGERAEAAATRLRSAGIPNFFDPSRAVRALAGLATFGRIRDRDRSEPLRFDLDQARIDDVLATAADRPDGRLSVEATEFLEAAGIPTPAGDLATSAPEAEAVARRVGAPVVMKVASPDVLHKSDVGGVEMGVEPADAAGAYEALVGRVRTRRPDATILGVRVEQQVAVDAGVETIVGVTRDPQFGPLVMFGLGGIYVQVYEDVSFRMAPVSANAAREMTEEIGAAAMLRGARGREPVDLDAVATAIGRLAHAAVAFPRIRELDVNPLLATPEGVTALDFRLAVDPSAG